MKKILFPVIMILLSVLMMAAIPTEAEGAIYQDTVRLHILANSDTEEDQTLKIALRDAVLEEYGSELSFFENAEKAKEELKSKIPEIEEFTKEKIREFGYEYPAQVTLTTEWYETRDYENFSLPSGYYSSLQIIVGEGEGKNWWCVMFPPLCLDAAVDKIHVEYSDAENLLISKKYAIKFKILELIMEIGK